MPPKASKKAVEKQKAKIIEDKTFGLKNKNKSAKVQKFVQDVQKNVKGGGNPAERARMKEQEERRAKKEEKKAFEEEMAKLFNAVKDDKKVPGQKEGEEEGAAAYDPDNYLWRAEDFDDVEEDDTRLEEKLENEREALRGRTDLTPVTEESFQAWKQRKREEAAAKEMDRLRKAKADNKLRGWDLWQDNQDLFVDDDEAEELYEREEEEEEEEGGAASAGAAATHVDPTSVA